MEREVNKFHALQLFTDTFSAETVHLTNQAVGIYIRLLCFAWTKNTKPFTSESAYRICQCIDDTCRKQVDYILQEFFKCKVGEDAWVHKRLVQEHEYLTDKYKKRSMAGKKGAMIRHSANGKSLTPNPNPNPKPNNINTYDPQFEQLWDSLGRKRGSKFKAHETWLKLWSQGILKESDNPLLIQAYQNQVDEIEDVKFVPHFSTWLSQRRWENDESVSKVATILQKMEKLGYKTIGTESNFTLFIKDGIKYKIDRYDKDHIIHRVE
jgi:uncharacterized protein YdaU (DUF1376 family)